MTDNQYTHSEKGANLSVIKINASHCYCCGDMFQPGGDKKKTNHHSIPEEFNPVRNFTIPVCLDCHKRIHTGTSMSKEEKTKLSKIVKGMANQYNLLVPKFDSLKEILK
jgi:hypothetical protein